MTKRFSRLLTLLLACVMVICCLPMAASADGGDYAVLGVQNGDRIILNPGIGGYTDFQHKVTIVNADQVANFTSTTELTSNDFTLEPLATGIASVEFAIDGATVATDSEAPYEFALGAEHAGENKVLTATITTEAGSTEVKTITYTGIYGELTDYRLVNYDSGVLDASNTPTFNGNKITGRTIENGALKIGGDMTVNSVWLQPGAGANTLLKLGDAKLLYVDYDLYKTHEDLKLTFRTSKDENRGALAGSTVRVGSAMPAREWVHVTVVTDCANGKISAYMNGVQFASSALTANPTTTATDNFIPYLEYGADRFLYVDNYAVRTYETAQDRTYSISGVYDADLPMNLTSVPVTTKTVGLNDIRGVSKVEYFVDGELAGTVNTLPFSFDVPITKLNADITVSAKVYAQTVKECAPVKFKAVYVDESSTRLSADTLTFDSSTGTVTATGDFGNANTRSGAYSYTYVDAEAEGLGRTGKVIKYDRAEGVANTNGGLLSTKTVGFSAGKGSANPWVKFCLDFYLPADKTYTSNDKIFITDATTYQDAVVCDLSKMEKGKWHSLVAYIDGPNREVIGNVDDATTVVKFVKSGENGATSGMLLNGTYVALYVKSFTDLYVDNIRVNRVVPTTTLTGKSFLNGINYVKDNDSVNTTVSFANLSTGSVDATVYFALYNGENTLVKAWAEPITVDANGFMSVNKDVAFAQNGKTGTTVKAFCWAPGLQPIGSIR